MEEEKVCAALGLAVPTEGIEWIVGILELTFGNIVTGTLKGYDALMNLVLDDVQEVLRGELFLVFFKKRIQ